MLMLATRWWDSDGSDDYFGRVQEVLETEIALVPELLKAMVQTGGPGALKRIGTGPVEELQMNLEFGYREGPPTLDLVIAANLDPVDLREVLAGVYVDILEKMGARERLAGLMSPNDLEWLLDDDAPGRRDFL
jgi:hypothetical protein